MASSSASSLPDTDLLFKCRICSGDFDDPTVLPCGHTFCFKCLQETTVAGQEICCPRCKEATRLPAEEAFTKNYVVAMIRELEKANKTTDQRPECETCDSNDAHPALSHCATCNQFLCDICCQGHKRFTMNHKIKSVDEMRSCCEHKEKISIFCRTCSVPICNKCSNADHQSHDTEDLAEAAIKCKAVLNTATQSASQYRKHLGAMKSALLETKNKVDQDCSAAIKQAERAAEVITERVQSQLTHIKTDITSLQKKAIGDIMISVEHYDNLIRNPQLVKEEEKRESKKKKVPTATLR